MKKVLLYALSTCPYCGRVKEYLDENGVKYECIDVDLLSGGGRQKALDDMKVHNPSTTFPTLIAGDNVVIGAKMDRIKEILGL